MSEKACQNTDREVWRGKSRAAFGDPDRFYADSLSIPLSEVEALTIHCDGMAVTKPIREWHALAVPAVVELSWRDLADAVEREAPKLSPLLSLAELIHITRILNEKLAATARVR